MPTLSYNRTGKFSANISTSARILPCNIPRKKKTHTFMSLGTSFKDLQVIQESSVWASGLYNACYNQSRHLHQQRSGHI